MRGLSKCLWLFLAGRAVPLAGHGVRWPWKPSCAVSAIHSVELLCLWLTAIVCSSCWPVCDSEDCPRSVFEGVRAVLIWKKRCLF